MPLNKNVKFWHWCIMIHRIYTQPYLNRRHFCILLCQLCSHEQLPLATGLRAFWFTGSKLFFPPPYIPLPRTAEKRREEKRREEKRREREEKRREESYSMPVTMGCFAQWCSMWHEEWHVCFQETFKWIRIKLEFTVDTYPVMNSVPPTPVLKSMCPLHLFYIRLEIRYFGK